MGWGAAEGGVAPETSAGAAGTATGGADTAPGGQGGATGCPVVLPAPIMVDPDGYVARLRVVDDPPGSEIGTFDPSLVSATDGSLAMSYTSVDLARRKLHTRIAVSTDSGGSFVFAAIANLPEEGLLVEAPGDAGCPGGTCADATLVHEVSGLVEDPADPEPSRRWKLFTHSYIVLAPAPEDPNTPRLRYQYGQLRMGTAATAAGPWSAPAPLIGWPSAWPSSLQAPQVTTALGRLEECVALTEPSGAFDPETGALELAVGCVAPAGSQHGIRIELLRSLDHGATWSHAGTLLEAADAPCVGDEELQLNAAHLFASGGKRYLIASPAGPVSLPGDVTGSGYRGCLVFPRAGDGVERDALGAPIVVARIDAGEGVFAGACSHHPAGGYFLSAVTFASPPDLFRMFGPIGAAP
ncbi:uncharacterized protein SOCEGT47_051720 [Sorangium cellulosum]|uniref:Sialidase domain-containing protein n=1 Tax=Sorangium cellulosum TaxID=56 RepID=A0A4P2Q6J1_SORCE|nr:hypothetical protein [Sorangium cellulosum]AUX24633.1 uncharacterized protein SOCEGT47_051720 [Sorangium cellulosum]